MIQDYLSMPKILTLHPEGKNGVNIDLEKYEKVKHAILEFLGKFPDVTFSELNKGCTEMLQNQFEGVIGWYVISVQKDLEARGIVFRRKVKGKMLLCLGDKTSRQS